MAGLLLLFPVSLALCALMGYFLGSVNSGILVTRAFQNGADIREQGSGNAGMTNVIRTVGKKAGALTFAGDFLKCVLACGLAALFAHFVLHVPFFSDRMRLVMYLTGAACVIGHMFPVFFGFRGGKGIATANALMLMSDWRIFLLIWATFLLVFAVRRIISLSSVVCAAMYPVYAAILYFAVDRTPYAWAFFGFSLFVGVLVLWRHRANIARLLRGEEKPLGGGTDVK